MVWFPSFQILMRDARQRKMKIIRIKAYLENLQIQFTEKNCKMHALIKQTNVFYPFTLSCCLNVGSISVSEKLQTYPSPNPTLTLIS